MARNTDASGLSPLLCEDVLARLGFSSSPSCTLEGLAAVYAAWCAHVPFDNVRKMLVLSGPESQPLPGIPAANFFEGWLAHGCGGTCWPSSNALLELLQGLNFDASRLAGSMRDCGTINHATVKVRIDGDDWLADSSMLTNKPLPLAGEVYISHDPVYGVEVEPDGGTHVIWFDVPPHADYYPCRLMGEMDKCNADRFYAESRGRSAFNDRLYARRNYADRMVVLRERTLFEKSASGLRERTLTAQDIPGVLIDEIGISEVLVDSLVRSGALKRSQEVRSLPSPAPVSRPRPSMRQLSE